VYVNKRMMDKKLKEMLESHLRIKELVTAKKYARFVQNWGTDSILAPQYWRMIPTYIVSRCPFCDATYQQKINNYSLYLWSIRGNADCVAYSAAGYERCLHFVGVHSFINLAGYLPYKNELEEGVLFSSEPEVPMVTPTLLPDDIESYAVLHSLPICRPWNDRFLVRYLLFMLTYYSTAPKELKNRRLAEWTGGYYVPSLLDVDRPWSTRLGIYWEEANTKPEAWDLLYWVKKGKLKWLDLARQDLPLTNEVNMFPYAEIRGMRHGYRYTNKEFETVSTNPTIEEFRTNLKTYNPEVWAQRVAFH
jgi:hypothetical protein